MVQRPAGLLMATDIRTPDDERDTPGYFYPPFREGWWYQGQTYSGHSDFAVDWNRRTRTGGWLDDRGDPVLAAADGTVAEVTPVDGYVAIDHWGGTYRSEYRHMQPVTVKVGDKVQRGDRIGSIGEAGNAPNGTHLHHRQYRRVGSEWRPIKQRFLGKPVEVSVSDSDTRPAGWNPPTPVMVQGPPPKATWQSAFREATKQLGTVTDELTTAKETAKLLQQANQTVAAERDKALADLAACQAANPADCHAETDRALIAEQKVSDALAVLTR